LNPKVSIIIPNYNHAKFLINRLDSVFNQTFQNFEVIILDDASTDISVDVLSIYKNHPKVSHFIINKSNSGSSFKQWKKGIDLAKGKYLWIAESDDFCENNFLENLINKLEDGLDICYCQSYDVDENGNNSKSRIGYTKEFKPNLWKHDFRLDGDIFNLNYLLVKNVIPNASAVVFKKSSLKSEFFNETLLKMKMCGDWLFWIKLCSRNRIGFISKPLNYFRNHSSTTRNHFLLIEKKNRLKEESALRDEIYLSLDIKNDNASKELYKKWFQLHKFIEIFSLNFYNIKLYQTSLHNLILDFIRFKLKNYI
jgi:glycosyltransferase involved in cell wall biosynthesis